jgi:hypothetical protein
MKYYDYIVTLGDYLGHKKKVAVSETNIESAVDTAIVDLEKQKNEARFDILLNVKKC